MMSKTVKSIFFLSVIFLTYSEVIYSQRANLSVETKKTIDDYKSLITKFKQDGNLSEEAKYLNQVAYLYWQSDMGTDAVDYFRQSLAINQQLENINAVKVIYGNLGLIYMDLGDYHSAILNFNESLRINRAIKKKADIASDLINLADALHEIKKYDESNIDLEEALDLAKELNDLEMMQNCYKLMADNYDKLGNSQKSQENFELYASIQKHQQQEVLKSLEYRTKTAEEEAFLKEKQLKNTRDTLSEMEVITREMKFKNELLRKQKELQDMTILEEKERNKSLEASRKAQLMISVISGIAGLLVTIILVLVFIQFRQKKKANLMLHEQNSEIQKQRDLTEKQHQKITDSIFYAKRIQNALLPTVSTLDEALHEYFIFYQPRDIVSGDFYWVTCKDNVLVLAAADCTGHGVPGAFMSMLGVALLNEIVNKIAINRHVSGLMADEILNELRSEIVHSLHQTGKRDEPKDGMDIALCIIDYENHKLQYAGAHNPLYIIRQGKLTELKANRMSLSHSSDMNNSFTRHDIDLEQGDLLYVFSDGYIDQFGGDKGYKYMAGKLKELLISVYDKSLEQQKALLEESFNTWKGNFDQLDDVLVIGFKFVPGKAIEKAIKGKWEDKKILIAEDTDINYFLLIEALKHTKAEVFRANNGKEAFEFCKSNSVDLILMDIKMPVMNGFEATKAIKAIKPEIPIVVQTAMNFENEEEDSLKAGANDFISKPIDLKTFIFKLEKFLG